ncbi:hypothetical protein [Zunongwangia atlantica]|uniref:Lipoprotein n=1 Tax=Zunongwangia atlantica 22II14-10F7 TaxID=1185767 RepID=A0A1Y1T3N6_9FLAO|nr:hypothetical protein [Zunongwangia atlantica]ORL45651.1 hypothetical protein IIF7_10578 [Zunongwangia atlantica 22II14-10F7]
MRKLLSVLFLGSLLSCGNPNTEPNQEIDWKAGENKELSINVHAIEMHNNKTIKDSILKLKGAIAVNEEKDDAYFIDFSLENPLLIVATNFHDAQGNTLKQHSQLKTQLRIDKKELTAVLISEENYFNSLSASKEAILNLLKEEAPDKLSEATTAINNIEAEMISTKMIEQIPNMLLKTYTIKYLVSDTITMADSTANPFNLKQFDNAVKKNYVENRTKEALTIVSETQYDLDAYKKKIENLKDTMVPEVNENTSETELIEISKLLDTYLSNLVMSNRLDASDKITITKTKESNWPKHIKQSSMISLKNSELNSKGIIEISIDIE